MELQQKSKLRNIAFTLLLASNGVIFGYSVGIFNPLGPPLFRYVYNLDPEKDKEQSNNYLGTVFMILSVGALVGTFFLGYFPDKIGRKPFIIAAEVVMIVTTPLYLFTNIYVLSVARFFTGFYITCTSISYKINTELLPNSVAGLGNMLSYVMLTTFVFVAYLTQIVFDEETLATNFRPILMWPSAICLVRLCLYPLLFKTDTPQYISMKATSPEDRTKKLTECFSHIYVQEDVPKAVANSIKLFEGCKRGGNIDIRKLLGREYRKRFWTGLILGAGQQVSGINFLIFFSTKLFDDISGNGKVMTLVVGGANILGGIFGLWAIGAFGRKFNLMLGILLQGVAMFGLWWGSETKSSVVLTISVVLYMFIFAVGFGGSLHAYLSETLPSLGFGLALGMQWLITALIGQFLPNLMASIGTISLIIIFGVFCLGLFFVLDYLIIETKGKDENTIVKELRERKYSFLDCLKKTKPASQNKYDAPGINLDTPNENVDDLKLPPMD